MEDFIEVLLQILYLAFQKMGGNPELDEKRKKRRNVIFNVLFVLVLCAIFGCLGTGIAFLVAGGNFHIAGIVLVSIGSGMLALLLIFIITAIAVGLKKLKKKKNDKIIDID